MNRTPRNSTVIAKETCEFLSISVQVQLRFLTIFRGYSTFISSSEVTKYIFHERQIHE